VSDSAHSVAPHQFIETWLFVSRIWRYS